MSFGDCICICICIFVQSRGEPRKIQALDVSDDGTLSNQRGLIDAGTKGTPDGFRVDIDGNLWCG